MSRYNIRMNRCFKELKKIALKSFIYSLCRSWHISLNKHRILLFSCRVLRVFTANLIVLNVLKEICRSFWGKSTTGLQSILTNSIWQTFQSKWQINSVCNQRLHLSSVIMRVWKCSAVLTKPSQKIETADETWFSSVLIWQLYSTND